MGLIPECDHQEVGISRATLCVPSVGKVEKQSLELLLANNMLAVINVIGILVYTQYRKMDIKTAPLHGLGDNTFTKLVTLYLLK